MVRPRVKYPADLLHGSEDIKTKPLIQMESHRRAWVRPTTMFVLATFVALFLLSSRGDVNRVWGRESFTIHDTFLELEEQITLQDDNYSLDVSHCPGYALSQLRENEFGLTAQLNLAGEPCDAFGHDISNLTIEVTYETSSRLHVNIFDTANNQFRIPESVISRPPPPTASHTKSSDLVFNYESAPFAFWITRRSDANAQPLFDTRPASLPSTPTPPFNASDNSTAFNGFQLVFEDQYLQLTSALPLGANIYGLGEVVSSSGFRRDVGIDSKGSFTPGTIQTLWARDDADPINENIYGSHSIYLDHRYDEQTGKSQSHGVFLLSSAGSDIILSTPHTPAESLTSLIQYRLIGGTLDLYFLSGPTPVSVIEQYSEIVGLPTWQPYWGFGFHLCRWGYQNISETKEQVTNMRAADIPLEVMWNDIDLYHAVRDFTTDPVSFPISEVKAFIEELQSNNQHYIPIVDAAVAKQVNATDIYDPYTSGDERNVFITNEDGSEYVGQVWPGYTVFPDWFAENTTQWWTEALKNWSDSGVEFSGIWLDMNEASSFCDGSCGSGIDISNTSVPFPLPGDPGDLITDYPEGYNSTISGPSGNITINGTLTYGIGRSASELTSSQRQLLKREMEAGTGLGASDEQNIDINVPPYAIHNGFGRLSIHTIATNATHSPGYAELDVHNMFGLMEERTTHSALLEVLPGKRPFIIARSTFPSTGKWSGHWLGDNLSKWQYMHFNIQGILQFQLYQIPMVGADTCGFMGNTDEELCNRWMQLSAFAPFYRNHNQRGALPQEPYRWDSVANASRTAIAVRYSMLPYWYSLFANASSYGTPPVRALFFEFPDEPELFSIDQQFMVGRDILVTPVLTPNVSVVNGIFPGKGNVIWRDWYTHNVVSTSADGIATLDAPLGHINVHIRDGSALLLHAEPAYTIYETRQGPFELLVSLSVDGTASGSAYVDDGISYPPGPSSLLSIRAAKGRLSITLEGNFQIPQKIQKITILGTERPSRVNIENEEVNGWQYLTAQNKLVVSDLELDLNKSIDLTYLS